MYAYKIILHASYKHFKIILKSKSEVNKSIKVPETKKQVKSFLGLIGYYRSYIERFAEIALSLTKMTKNNITHKLI